MQETYYSKPKSSALRHGQRGETHVWVMVYVALVILAVFAVVLFYLPGDATKFSVRIGVFSLVLLVCLAVFFLAWHNTKALREAANRLGLTRHASGRKGRGPWMVDGARVTLTTMSKHDRFSDEGLDYPPSFSLELWFERPLGLGLKLQNRSVILH